jgi:uncharacterized protein (TIGR02679 family)
VSATCRWCSGGCAGADLEALLAADLRWLWDRVAAEADRRGDAELVSGRLRVSAPAAAEERSAAVGLLGGRLLAGQRRTVDLDALTSRLQARSPQLTPGVVAAHATGRRLAGRAAERVARRRLEDVLRADLLAGLAAVPPHVADRVDTETVWDRLTRAGVLARLAGRADAATLLRQATAVLTALPAPGRRIDRRTLVPGAPHAVDEGTPLAWLVLALAGQSGRRTRAAWDALGVDIDDLTGGLLTLGMHPAGWSVPAGAVLTLPPRELAAVTWPAPPDRQGWVFVTENPSVVAAATDRVRADPQASVRLLCTVGTPSAVEAAAVAALADAGWSVAVRADFDAAGLFHVRTLLAACPAAVPWRMGTTTYLDAARSFPGGEQVAVTAAESPWDANLGPAIAASGVLVFEEDVLDLLLGDLLVGRPPDTAA